MFKDYIFKKPRRTVSSLESTSKGKMWTGIFTFLSLFLLSVGVQAQTTLIGTSIGGTSVADGTFSTGATFAANGWTVANQGTSSIKWAVGTAVNSGAITGNSAYVSLDNGATNTQAGLGEARTIYFYKDVAIPSGETNIALTFDWKSAANTWQVFVAPTSVAVSGADSQTNGTSSPFSLTGATPVVLSATSATTTNAFGLIPASMAGTTVRLIFMWTNNTGGTNPPLAIDNIKLVSRAGGAFIQSVATGNFTSPSTWSTGYVPCSTDDVQINANHTVTIDAKTLGSHDLYLSGSNAILNFGVNSDEYTVANDLAISGSGAAFNVFYTTTGRSLVVGHDISLASGGRLDISTGNTSAGFGTLTLNGTALQTISNSGGNFGGTVTSTTTTNTVNVLNQLVITNTSTATPNISWGLNNVRIKSALKLNNARVDLGANKIIIGNYAAMTTASNLVYNPGSGFMGGTIAKYFTTSALGNAIDPGLDYNDTRVLFPAITSSGDNRWAFIVLPASGTTAGELNVAYTNGTGTTGVSVVDGAYTITDRYNGSWAITSGGYASAASAFSVGFYGSGAYFVNDGSSRVMKSASVVGGNINGTTSPFVARNGLTLSNITTGAFYIGVNSSAKQAAATKTSNGSGNWNTAGTWTPSGVPSCSDVVAIASGHTVTVNTSASAAGVTINAGGTLVNAAGGNLTVGCTDNNAIFTNFGTNNVTGGTLTVNGSVSHRAGSTFSHTAGNIVVDSNDAGNAATSVGQGGSSFAIATPNVTLTGGTITIVDPLVNNTVGTTATSVTSISLDTVVTFTRSTNADAPSGSSIVLMTGFNSANSFYPGQYVTGTGIAPGTTVTNVVAGQISNQPFTITLSTPTTATITAGTSLTFSGMSNGGNGINMPISDPNASLLLNAVGVAVSGPGIPANTYTTGTTYGISDTVFTVFLNNNVSGLGTSPIASAQTITFAGASPNSKTIILTAPNALIVPGQIVGGVGIAAGTAVSTTSTVNGMSRLDLTLPTTGAMTAPVSLSFYDGNLSSCAFAYNSATSYAAGLNHTLQIGNGSSTDKGAVTTNGFLCDFAQGGGTLSLGKLTVDAPDGNNRFFNSNNIVVVQSDLNITAGSVFKKSKNTGNMYFGGNITNNGTMYSFSTTQVYFSNPTSATGATSLAQTVSGSGNIYNDLDSSVATGTFNRLTVYNTNAAGVTISVPNFRIISTITMTDGIIHTSSANPLYQGTTDLSSFGTSLTGNFGNTCYIDGPFVKSIVSSQSSTQFQLFPVGKTSYQPVYVGVSGGAILKGEAFTSNSGTASGSIANLSSKRWTVSRVGVSGSLTDFNVRLGDAGITSNNIVVQAPSDQGTYTNTFGNTATFTAGSPNTVETVSATAGASYTGNFAYATLPNCSVVNPGNTVASLTVSKGITQQRSTSGNIQAGSTTVILNAVNTSIVNGLTVTGTGIAPGTTVANISGTTLTLSQNATATSTGNVDLVFTSVTTPTTLCGTQQVALSLQNAIPGNGVTYQWQSSADNVTYSPIAGATASTYIANATSPWYRCAVTCPYGPLTVTSTPVQVNFTNNITSTTPANLCSPGVANLAATANAGTITWYADATGGTPLATGSTYAPTVSGNTTYYVGTEVVGTPYTTGRAFSGTSSNASPYSGIVFTATTNIKLNSVKVYPKQTSGAADAGAQMTIALYDANNNVVAGTSPVMFTPSANIGTMGAVSQVVPVNYDIPAGTGYKLVINNGISSTNSLGSAFNTFMYPIGTVSSSVSLTAGLSALNTTSTSNVYNFFDLNVTDMCASTRKSVAATIVPNCAEIKPEQCGITLDNINSYAYCNLIKNAQSYTWEVTALNGPNVGQVQTKVTPLRQLKLSYLPTFAYNTQYSIKVAATIGGVLQAYGPACSVTTASATTSLTTCGGTVASANDWVYCNIVQYAQGYQFTVTNASDALDTQTINSDLRRFRFSDLSGILASTAYNVTVRVKNLDGTYLPAGAICTITSPAATGRGTNSNVATAVNFNAVSYPNPFTNDFRINVSSISQEKVQINVYDMVGRLVENKVSSLGDLQSITIGNNYQAGVYNIVVSQGDNTKTLRVVKK